MINILLSNYDIDKDWLITETSKYINKHTKVVVIPFSFSNDEIKDLADWDRLYNKINGVYCFDIINQFLSLGVDKENILLLNYFTEEVKTMKKIIEQSDAVFFTGGSAELSMERIIEKDLLQEIKKCNIIIGSSAGAMIQLKEYFGSPDDEYPEFKYFEGLGLINDNFSIEVHYSSTKSQDESIEKVLKKGVKTVYGISNNGALVYKDNQVMVFGDVTIFK